MSHSKTPSPLTLVVYFIWNSESLRVQVFNVSSANNILQTIMLMEPTLANGIPLRTILSQKREGEDGEKEVVVIKDYCLNEASGHRISRVLTFCAVSHRENLFMKSHGFRGLAQPYVEWHSIIPWRHSRQQDTRQWTRTLVLWMLQIVLVMALVMAWCNDNHQCSL